MVRRRTKFRYKRGHLDVTLEASPAGWRFTDNRDASGFFVPIEHDDPARALKCAQDMMDITLEGFRQAETERSLHRRIEWLPSRMIPKRVNDEVIGDAAEKIVGMIRRADPRWRIALVCVSSLAVIVSECVRYFVRAFRGQRR
jgi:hypothetical protein